MIEDSNSMQKQQNCRDQVRVNQYKINRIFAQNQKRVYKQMDGVRNINNEKPNAEESKNFWSNMRYN